MRIRWWNNGARLEKLKPLNWASSHSGTGGLSTEELIEPSVQRWQGGMLLEGRRGWVCWIRQFAVSVRSTRARIMLLGNGQEARGRSGIDRSFIRTDVDDGNLEACLAIQ